MNLISAFAFDLGTYVVAMALFAAVVCYRANPLRAVNRFMSAILGTIAIWQLFVVLARTTHDVALWAPLCLPCGLLILVFVFLVHDACVDAHAPLRRRLARIRTGWITVFAFCVAALPEIAFNVSPILHPLLCRVLAVVALMLGLYQLRMQRRKARAVNPYEVLLFQVTAIYFTMAFAIFELNRTSLSSRVNTVLTFIYLSVVIGLLFAERVFDAGSTARIALLHVVRFVIHGVILLGIVELYSVFVPTGQENIWALALLVAITVYPVGVASNWVTRKTLHSFDSRAESNARDAAMEILGSAESERLLIQRLEDLARNYLGGLNVSIAILPAGQEPPDGDPRSLLATKVRRAWLSPDTVVREFRGRELDELLHCFAETKTGAVVKFAGRQVAAVMYVGERGGGTHPITGRELDLLHELTTIAGTGVDRLRAVEDGFRAQALAMVGRLAADMNQSARAQISGIHALVEAVKDGKEAQLSKEYRQSVYEQTLALAANHNMALEITRLRPGKLTIKPLSLALFLESLVTTFEQMVSHGAGHLEIHPPERGLAVSADERLLRQVFFNLLRNSSQACEAAKISPVITIRAFAEGENVHIDVIDNGPGVPAEIYDRLFSPWTTTQAERAQLGLSFCLQAMRAIDGNISYLTPRGLKSARFRVDVPRAASPTADYESVGTSGRGTP